MVPQEADLAMCVKTSKCLSLHDATKHLTTGGGDVLYLSTVTLVAELVRRGREVEVKGRQEGAEAQQSEGGNVVVEVKEGGWWKGEVNF